MALLRVGSFLPIIQSVSALGWLKQNEPIAIIIGMGSFVDSRNYHTGKEYVGDTSRRGYLTDRT